MTVTDIYTGRSGVILGREDEDRVWVVWGDSRYADDPWTQARIAWRDDLRIGQ